MSWRKSPDRRVFPAEVATVLYDTTADVIRKALRGLNLAPATAAFHAGLQEKEVLAASRGESPGLVLRQLAPVLGLDPQALAGLPGYRPIAELPPEITRLELPFDDETVNAWLIRVGELSLLFDTGDGEEDVKDRLEELGVAKVDVIITHSHHDHIGGVRGLGSKIRTLSGPEGTATRVIHHDETIQFDSIKIRAISLPGHCDGALGYLIDGLSIPLWITGDALFSGSIGGCPPGGAMTEAIDALKSTAHILKKDTLILPGHGPATTVGQELVSNPFIALPQG